jgi:hypothetical protein
MQQSLFDLRYSFICRSRDCNHQFETLLQDLVKPDQIACPKCSTAIDIRQSKVDGDLARIFREGMTRKHVRRKW